MEELFMKKTMRKSALLSSVAMLIVSAIVLTSATYAWFTSSKKVEVTELEANVKVTTGLLISVDKGNEWGTSFEFSDAVALKDGWGKASEVTVFNPVSTADGNDWIAATFEDAETGLVEADVNLGKDFVAVPLYVTGPAGATVEANVTFDGTDEQSAKCMKFALLAVNDEMTVTDTYNKAVAADDSTAGFNGISTIGTVTDTVEKDENAYVSNGGTSVSEVAAEGGITFTIPADNSVSTDAPMKFVVYVWLEGNDSDCAMMLFDTQGEDVAFNMALEIVE